MIPVGTLEFGVKKAGPQLKLRLLDKVLVNEGALAGVILSSDGTLTTVSASGGAIQPTEWATPRNNAIGESFEARMVTSTGEINQGAPADEWIPLNTVVGWGVQEDGQTKFFTGTLQIRPTGGDVLVEAEMSFTSNGFLPPHSAYLALGLANPPYLQVYSVSESGALTELDMPLGGPELPVNDISWSTDGEHFVASTLLFSTGTEERVFVYRVADGEVTKIPIDGHSYFNTVVGYIYRAAISPDASKVIVGHSIDIIYTEPAGWPNSPPAPFYFEDPETDYPDNETYYWPLYPIYGYRGHVIWNLNAGEYEMAPLAEGHWFLLPAVEGEPKYGEVPNAQNGTVGSQALGEISNSGNFTFGMTQTASADDKWAFRSGKLDFTTGAVQYQDAPSVQPLTGANSLNEIDDGIFVWGSSPWLTSPGFSVPNPGREVQFASRSYDGTYLALRMVDTPRLLLYKFNGSSYSSITAPTAVTGSSGYDCKLDLSYPSGQLLAVPSSEGIEVFVRSEDTFTEVSSYPAGWPSGHCYVAAFNPTAADE